MTDPQITADKFVEACMTFSRVTEQYAARVTDKFRNDRIMDLSRLAAKVGIDELAQVQREAMIALAEDTGAESG